MNHNMNPASADGQTHLQEIRPSFGSKAPYTDSRHLSTYNNSLHTQIRNHTIPTNYPNQFPQFSDYSNSNTSYYMPIQPSSQSSVSNYSPPPPSNSYTISNVKYRCTDLHPSPLLPSSANWDTVHPPPFKKTTSSPVEPNYNANNNHKPLPSVESLFEKTNLYPTKLGDYNSNQKLGYHMPTYQTLYKQMMNSNISHTAEMTTSGSSSSKALETSYISHVSSKAIDSTPGKVFSSNSPIIHNSNFLVQTENSAESRPETEYFQKNVDLHIQNIDQYIIQIGKKLQLAVRQRKRSYMTPTDEATTPRKRRKLNEAVKNTNSKLNTTITSEKSHNRIVQDVRKSEDNQDLVTTPDSQLSINEERNKLYDAYKNKILNYQRQIQCMSELLCEQSRVISFLVRKNLKWKQVAVNRLSTYLVHSNEEDYIEQILEQNLPIAIIAKDTIESIYNGGAIDYYPPKSFYCNELYASLLHLDLKEIMNPNFCHRNIGFTRFNEVLRTTTSTVEAVLQLLYSHVRKIKVQLPLQDRYGRFIVVDADIYLSEKYVIVTCKSTCKKFEATVSLDELSHPVRGMMSADEFILEIIRNITFSPLQSPDEIDEKNSFPDLPCNFEIMNIVNAPVVEQLGKMPNAFSNVKVELGHVKKDSTESESCDVQKVPKNVIYEPVHSFDELFGKD